MRYGMNPHQAARMVEGRGAVRVLAGKPSLINWLDLLNGWMLVREVREAPGRPVAASFKHVSPAGVAAAGPIDEAPARLWRIDPAWLRRHPLVRGLSSSTLRRRTLLNWRIRFAEQNLTPQQEDDLTGLFGSAASAAYRESSWRAEWAAKMPVLTMTSDGFIPLRDNIEVAAGLGVRTVIEPGGSFRSGQVDQAAIRHGIEHLTTGLRLFHH